MLSGRVFHICGPTVVRLLVPYLVVLCLNDKIVWSNVGINFKGKNIFHKGRV